MDKKKECFGEWIDTCLIDHPDMLLLLKDPNDTVCRNCEQLEDCKEEFMRIASINTAREIGIKVTVAFAEIAQLIEQSPKEQANVLWENFSSGFQGIKLLSTGEKVCFGHMNDIPKRLCRSCNLETYDRCSETTTNSEFIRHKIAEKVRAKSG